jgi:hypothetical protein
MTTSLERPVMPVSADGKLSLVEPHGEAHAVVTLHLAVSRDQLAAAVEDAATKGYGIQDPDELTVAEIRSLAAWTLSHMSALELEQGGEAMAYMAGPDADDLSLQRYIHAVYRAVDRAYPALAE